VNHDLLEGFRRCRARADTDEARIAALVARVLDPLVDPSAVEADLQVLADACPLRQPPWTYLAQAGFEGNTADYGALDNSNLARVLETRRGIPITLGTLLLRVARTAGRRAAGINFPGHFLVQVDEVLVDPFVMQVVQADRVVERLPAASRRLPRETLFAAASPVAVGLRMLNNIKLIHAQGAAWHRALDVVDAQLALAPDHPALHLERGDLWRRLGSVAPARESWQRALDLAEATGGDELEQVRRAVRTRIDEVGGSGDVIH